MIRSQNWMCQKKRRDGFEKDPKMKDHETDEIKYKFKYIYYIYLFIIYLFIYRISLFTKYILR